VDIGHLELIGLNLHNSVCNIATWPTPLELFNDLDDNIQYLSFAALLVKGRANPKGVDNSQLSWPNRLDNSKGQLS